MPDHFYVYPAYVAQGAPRTGGRRVPAAATVKDVTAEEIAQAAKRLGYRAEVEADKQYPRDVPRGAGRVKVTKRSGVSKGQFLRLLVSELPRVRASGGGPR